MTRILVDAGPLVALFSKRDSHHEECTETWKSIQRPVYACWPVLTQAAWMLRPYHNATEQMLESAEQGLFSILALNGDDAAAIADIMRRYSKLRPQLADAALVHLADREKIGTVFTLDQRDFRVYRTRSNRPLRLLP